MGCACLRNRRGRAVAGRATDGCARLRTCRCGVSAQVCVLRLTQAGCDKLRQAGPRGCETLRRRRRSRPNTSRWRLMSTRGGRLGPWRTATRDPRRGGRRHQGEDFSHARRCRRDLRRPARRPARRRHRGGQRLEHYNARSPPPPQNKKPRSLRPAGRCISSQTPRSCPSSAATPSGTRSTFLKH